MISHCGLRTPVCSEVHQIQGGEDVATLFYIHDPMCSWCWGFRPVFERLRERLPAQVRVARLLGGLAMDSDRPMPAEMQRYLQTTWHRIADVVPGTRFNFDFWARCEPRRSTWPACRAVIAARQLAPDSEEAMILAIQQAYYLEARNPSDRQTLINLASALGINAQRFGDTLDSAAIRTRLAGEIQRARAMGVNEFPGLRLEARGTLRPIAIDYLDPTPMHRAITRLVAN
jgi:putative protein-disulfide isomerase